jgi:hypothetical protein
MVSNILVRILTTKSSWSEFRDVKILSKTKSTVEREAMIRQVLWAKRRAFRRSQSTRIIERQPSP